MARIPTVVSQLDARTGRTTQGIASRRASADAFGGGAAAGLQSIGQGLGDVGQGLYVRAEKKKEEDVANRVAQADFTRRELELRNEVGPGAEGYQERVLEEYDTWVDEQAEEIEDNGARAQFKRRMMGARNQVSSRSAQYELGTAAQHSKDQADASLVALDNKIRLSPDAYDEFIEQGAAVIDARDDLPAHVRSQMKTTWAQNAALSRFEGMLEAATTVEDVRALQGELRGEDGRDWTSELSAPGLERVTSLASSASKAIQTKADSDARAAIDFLEGRADDVTSIIPRDELRAAQDVVSKSGNPITAARMARIVRDQEIISETRRLTPSQQREVLEGKLQDTSLPSRLNAAITKGAQMFGVSPAYLAATAKREYGMFLTGNEDDVDYGKGNADGTSSATGVMQFTEGTWLEVANNPRFQAATGISTQGMSRQQILDMRKDVDLAMLGGAFFTAENARVARSALGREPTDADLYIMHFMGRGGGPRLFRLVQSNPDMSAPHLFPEQAAANKSVYYNRDGSERTVLEVYKELGRKHGTEDGAETYFEYGDRETRGKVLDDTEARLTDDPMEFAVSVGNAVNTDIFSEGGMQARGDSARAVADLYSIPAADMKPFTNSEETEIAKAFRDGSADDVLSILTSVQQMGGEMARAAMSQIGADGDVFAYAGGLQLETGQGGVAAEVVKGQKRIEENPGITQEIGATRADLSSAFLNATGGALLGAAPAQRQAISDAALAHYVETQVARGRGGKFDTNAYAASVQAVMGGRQGAPALDKVNGEVTVMPPGVTGATMERALSNMTVADWVRMSEQGEPPRYSTGEIADPSDLADEARLRAIGGGRYQVLTSDGQHLITGNPAPNGQLEPYIFVPTARDVRAVNDTADAQRAARDEESVQQAQRPAPADQAGEVAEAFADGTLTAEEQRALFDKYGSQWAYDSEGNRLAPIQ